MQPAPAPCNQRAKGTGLREPFYKGPARWLHGACSAKDAKLPVSTPCLQQYERCD